jgi:hypothetical protein
VNFTREPIIETVITPKDGYKLTIRNSKGGTQEEYSVDAIEIVSFGQSMFFRSQERPKTFLLPVSDYEVVEVKETRVVLKNAPLEGSIKIGGGKPQHKPALQKESGEEKSIASSKPHDEETEDRPRRRKSSSRRRREQEHHEARASAELKQPKMITPPPIQEGDKKLNLVEKAPTPTELEAPVSTAMFRGLIPPPTGLISEKLQHEKYMPYIKDISKEDKSLVQDQPVERASFDVVEDKQEDVAEEKVDEESDDDQKPSSPDKTDSEPRYHSAPKSEDGSNFFKIETGFAF